MLASLLWKRKESAPSFDVFYRLIRNLRAMAVGQPSSFDAGAPIMLASIIVVDRVRTLHGIPSDFSAGYIEVA